MIKKKKQYVPEDLFGNWCKTAHFLDVALAACIKGYPEISENLLKNSPEQDDARIIFNLGYHEMRHGNLKKGLQMMDAGRFINAFGLPRLPGEIWRDQDLNNKTLLFRCENGFGDQIMNFRFAKDFKNKGARVVVSCAANLMSLFSRHGFVCVDNNATSHVYYDYWVPSMSAAHILGYDTNNFPGKSYLTAKPQNLYSNPENLKVGIRWAGDPKFDQDQHNKLIKLRAGLMFNQKKPIKYEYHRKFNPQKLIDLHKIRGVSLYSLQRDNDLIDGLPFADLRDQMQTFEDTASIIQDLDLVITSCTSIAHLSAALGKETWVIVPTMPYYSWAEPKKTSVWYESVRLFRQTQYGNWDEPLNNIKKDLIKKINENTCNR